MNSPRIIAYAACLGFAYPSYAAEIGDPIEVPVTVTVQNMVVIPEMICAMPEDQRPEGVLCEVVVLDGE